METVLIAGSEPEARSWQRRHPGRWSMVVAANAVRDGVLRGLRIGSIHIAPGVVRPDNAHAALIDEARDVMAWSHALHHDSGERAEPVYLDRMSARQQT